MDKPERRHADPTLLALEELYGSLNDEATPDQAAAWWPLVIKATASIESDARATKAEQDALRRLRDRVSDIYGARNRGLPANYLGATIAVIGLQNLLEGRTTGLDGRRLR